MSIERIIYQDKEIVLVGTAHVSRHSVEEVEEVIEREQPDSVCVELCDSRYESLIGNGRRKKIDIIKAIKEKRTILFLINRALASFQGRIARQLGISPGQEMLQGIRSAKKVGADLVLADRDIRITFLRIWHSLSLKEKTKLILTILLSSFKNPQISEDELEKLQAADTLQAALNEFSSMFPELKRVLIDERDMYLAQKIKEATGHKVVAIVGAGHVPGIKKNINLEHNLRKLASLPPAPKDAFSEELI